MRLAGRDGRWVALAIGLIYALAWGWSVKSVGRVAAWQRLGVPASGTAFLDFQVVSSAAETARSGGDPYRDNPGDPEGRPFNYPKVWLLITKPWLTAAQVNALAGAIAVLALVALGAACGPLGWREGALLGAMVCSPMIMLGVERGNIELLVFAVLALGIDRLARGGPRVAAIGLGAAAVLKLFPICAVVMFARRGRWRIGAVLLIGFSCYLVAVRENLQAVRANTPASQWFSYGNAVIVSGLTELAAKAGAAVDWVRLSRVFFLASVALLAFGVRRGWQPAPAANGEADERHELAFIAGAAIYVATFVVGHAHFAYRLWFVLLCVPYLWRQRSWTLLPMAVLLWSSPRWWQPVWWIAQAASWVLFYAFVVALTERLRWRWCSEADPASRRLPCKGAPLFSGRS